MFYIKPPTGYMPLHVLEKCVYTRLDYLEHIYNNKTDEFNGNFEYLLENSIYDKTGHFTLRLLISTLTDLWIYWSTREMLLLRHRLNNMIPTQLNRFFRSIIRQLGQIVCKSDLISITLKKICMFYLQRDVFQHILSKSHLTDCNAFQCKVRFELVPDLVRKKVVNLSAGFAIIYCSQWKELFVSLFGTYVIEEMKCISSRARHIIDCDNRFNFMKQKIKCSTSWDGISETTHGRLTARNIDIEVKNFPPCMQHLHRTLRDRHRLSHYARLYFSLFLKEGGMKLEDAIQYWKEEYSKPHSCNSSCTHNWKMNEKKFIYSIRHLYGLEGSHRNYKSPNCNVICTQIPGATYEGGCPFKNFDMNKLKTFLNVSLTKEDVDRFLDIVSYQRPDAVCTNYFKLTSNTNTNTIAVNSPIQYYKMMLDSH